MSHQRLKTSFVLLSADDKKGKRLWVAKTPLLFKVQVGLGGSKREEELAFVQ